MPVYRSIKYIEESIQSVVDQTYPYWELIIIDDCGNDGSISIAEEYAKKYNNIRIKKNTANHGVAYSRNIGIEMSKGRFICFLDSDDKFDCTKLEKQYKFMIKMHIAFSYTNYRRIDGNNCIVKKCIDLPLKSDRINALCEMPMLVSTVMLDSQMIDKTKIKFPMIRTSEDRSCFAEILKDIPFAYLLDEVLTEYRIHSDSISGNRIRNIIDTWCYYRRTEHFSFFESLHYFIKYIYFAIKKRI